MKKIGIYSLMMQFSFITLIGLTAFSNDAVSERIRNSLPQVIKSIEMEPTINFAGEPMLLNMDTKERLDRELTVNAYWHSSTLLNIKLANKYLPTIERILREEGVPDDFKYLAIAESGLRNVGSSAGAKGFWQFRKLAAKEFNLEVNSEVDERYHIEKSTRAACQYLKQLYKRFNSWTNAAASYNVGPTKYRSVMNQQNESNYYNLNLNQETSRYVFRLLALKEIIKSPQDFGFYVDPHEKYEPMDNCYEVTVDKTVNDWAVFAKQYGLSYRMLKYYNPWLIDSKLTVKNNVYKIKIPRK